MKLTKTWLSYILWGLFSIILFSDIGIAAVEISQKTDTQISWIPIVSMYAYAILGIILVIFIYKLIERFVLSKISEETQELKGIAEIFAFVTLLIVAISVRFISVISATDGLEGTTEFYDYAITAIGSKSLDTYSNGAYLYGNILSFFLGFLGYKPTAAMAVQSGIQILTILSAYFAIKKGLGRWPAWICVLLMSFLPGSFLNNRQCTPDSLFTLFFVLYLLCLVYVGEANRTQKIKEKFHAFFFVLLGVFAAFLAYYDIIGMVAIVIGVVALIKMKNEEAWTTTQRTWFQLLLFLVAAIGGYVLMFWFMSINGCATGPEALILYWKECISSFELNLMLLSPHKGQWDSLALFIMSGLWFVGFLRDHHDKAFPYVIMIDVMTVFVFFGIGSSEYMFLCSFGWIMLSSIGITSLRRFRKTDKDVANAERAKRNSQARKEAKERRRKAASGEKSIHFDNMHSSRPGDENMRVGFLSQKTNASSSDFSSDITKKGYGIGRKADTPVQKEESQIQEDKYTPEMVVVKKEQYVKPEINEVHEAKAEPEIKAEPETKFETETRTVTAEKEVPNAKVAPVEQKPIVTAPVPVPVESKPSYSYGSPSRRAFRTPSKSTFTPEDLERIRQYTGINIATVNATETKKEDSAEAATAQTQPVLSNHVGRVEKVITPNEPQKDIQNEQILQSRQLIQSQQPAQNVEKTPAKQIQQPVSTQQSVASQQPATMHVTSGSNTNAVTQTKSQADRMPKLIRNPLPGPKPHVSRELNYDYMPKTSEMKYDIEDLKGKDYFDI